MFLTEWFLFSIEVFFHEHSRITGLKWKGEDVSLTPHYHFHPLYRHLDISRAVTAESSPLHIGSSRTRTGNPWFPSASRALQKDVWCTMVHGTNTYKSFSFLFHDKHLYLNTLLFLGYENVYMRRCFYGWVNGTKPVEDFEGALGPPFLYCGYYVWMALKMGDMNWGGWYGWDAVCEWGVGDIWMEWRIWIGVKYRLPTMVRSFSGHWR